MNKLEKILKYMSATAFISLFMLFVVPQYASANSSASNKLLAQVRAATAKYHDVAVAEAAGYVADPFCVPGMGYHYVNASLLSPGVTELEPEVLLYVDSPDGGRRLVGVEYLDFLTDENAPPNVPVLFAGREFDGPMPGHGPHMPWHYDLHVWIWSHNPDGTFATSNSNITCE